MTYSVYQHWDPLKVCVVGRSYPPEFYSFIKNSRVRKVFEKIAIETEEDYQKLIALLRSFNVDVLRPTVDNSADRYIFNNRILPPPMTPRDYTIMLGNDFYFKPSNNIEIINSIWKPPFKGDGWGDKPRSQEEINNLPEFVHQEIIRWFNKKLTTDIDPEHKLMIDYNSLSSLEQYTWGPVIQQIQSRCKIYHRVPFYLHDLNAAKVTRIGKDIYYGTSYYGEDLETKIRALEKIYPQYRWHSVNTDGHADGTYCPVCPGLIVSLKDVPTYKNTFPDWEVVYLPGQSWTNVKPFLDLKERNHGKWWVPGEESNDEFTQFVESWMDHWVGYVEETVFDVNMLVIDQKNVVCNNYNKTVFNALERHGVTPHIINFRHRYFWDGGLHCITSDLHREGTMQDYFPERS